MLRMDIVLKQHLTPPPPPSSQDTEVPSRIPKVVIDDEALADILGPPRFARDDTPAQRVDGPGIVMGMAATSVVGGLLSFSCCISLLTFISHLEPFPRAEKSCSLRQQRWQAPAACV